MSLPIANTSNVLDDASLKMYGSVAVETAVVSGTTFVFVAGAVDNGVSAFSVSPNGTLTNVSNVPDNSARYMEHVSGLATAQVGGTTYLFTAGTYDFGISTFSVGSGGTLTNVANKAGTSGDSVYALTTAVVGTTTYLFAAYDTTSASEGALAVFSVGTGGTLTQVARTEDNATLKLSHADSVATATVGGTTFAFVAGSLDNGVSVFSVANNGALTNVFNIGDDATLKLAGASSVATANVGGTTYLFVAGTDDDGVSVFSVASNGALTNVFNVGDNAALALDGAAQLTTAVVDGATYLFVTGQFDFGFSVFSVGSNGALTSVANVTSSTASPPLSSAYGITTDTVGGEDYLFVSSASGNLSAFSLGNTAPMVGANAGLTLNEGATATVTAAKLDFNDAEQADTAIVYTITTAATNGTLKKSGVALALNGTFTQDDINNSRITYTHDGSETTSASFGFSVSDGQGGTVTGQSFAFSVTPVNDPPVAAADSYTATKNTALTVNAASGVLANDTDVDTAAGSLSAIKVSDPAHGTLTLNADGSFTYTPANGYSGADSFTYQTSDGTQTSGVTTVSLAVTGGTMPNSAPTFLNGGKVSTSFSNDRDNPLSLTILADGKYLLAGSAGAPYDTYTFALARYNADGTLDTGFSGDGKLTTSISVVSRIFDAVQQSDGKVVVAGSVGNFTGYDAFGLVRYNADGTLDTTFGTNGIVQSDLGWADAAAAIALQSDGKFVVVGSSSAQSGTFRLAVARYNANGTLDSTFSGDGVANPTVGTQDVPYDILVQSDGKIVVTGYTYLQVDANTDIFALRLNSNGSLDTTFSSDGIVTTAITATIDIAQTVALSSGKVLVAGYTTINGHNQMALVRYTAAGALDTSFGGDGIVTMDIGGAATVAQSVVVQSDGKILVVGSTGASNASQIALVRFNSDGTVDTSFGGGDGIVTTGFAPGVGYGYDVDVQSDGKILVSGSTGASDNTDFTLLRYNSDGSLDTSFAGYSTVTATAAYTEGAAPVVLSPNIVITDIDSTNLTRATVRIADGFFPGSGDVLDANVAGSSITKSWNATTGTLTLSGLDTLAHYQQVLRTVTYKSTSSEPTDHGAYPTRNIEWQVFDSNTANATPFGTPTSLTTATGVFDGKLADLNGDGKLDLIYSQSDQTQVFVAFGDGTGAFGPQTAYTAGSGVRGVTIADFDRDGDLDLLVSLSTGSKLALLTNNGAGSFAAAQVVGSTTGTPGRTVTGDFNRDGKLDVIATGGLLPGNGDGTFGTQIPISGLPTLSQIVTGDFNNDGKLDFAAVTSSAGNVTVFAGNGDGTFATGVAYPVGGTSQRMSVGDIDNDGDLDLVATSVNNGAISLLLNSGTGTFTTSTISGIPTIGDIKLADYDGDGKLDIVVASFTSLRVYHGNGDGTFASVQTVANAAGFIVSGDLNGDGALDIVSLDITGTASSILLNSSTNQSAIETTVVTVTETLPPTPVLSAAATASFTENSGALVLSPSLTLSDDGATLAFATVRIAGGYFPGSGDVLAATTTGTSIAASYNAATGTLTLSGSDTIAHYQQVLRSVTYASTSDNPTDLGAYPTRTIEWQVSDGTAAPTTVFQTATTVALSVSNHLADVLADVNGDGNPDLIYDGIGGSSVYVAFGNGAGSFGTSTTYGGLGSPTTGLIAVDLDGDGDRDIVVAKDTLSYTVLRNDGAGNFTALSGVSIGASAFAAGDFDRDGKIDLVVTRGLSGNAQLIRGNGDGTFGDPSSVGAGNGTQAVVAADFNNDGKLDLALGGTNKVDLVLGDGNGGFGAATTTSINGGGGVRGLAVADFNNDGRLDIAVVEPTGFSILIQNANGSFTATDIAAGVSLLGIAVGDFNGDGNVDVAGSSSNGIRLLLGNGNGTFQAVQSYSSSSSLGAVAAADINHDGVTDLVGSQALSTNEVILLGAAANLSATQTTVVSVTAVDDAPVLTNLDATRAATEQTAVVLDGNATIADAELDAISGAGNYAGASLTIARSGGASAQDSFGFDATGALFTVNGGNLQSGGHTFATFTNSGGTLTVNFTGSGSTATSALTNDVLRHIAYTNTSDQPPLNATLAWTFHDGNTGAEGTGGDKTATGSIQVNINAVNDPPVLHASGTSASYTEGGAAVTIDPVITMTDPDDFSGLGYVRATISGGLQPGDVLGSSYANPSDYDSGTGVLTMSYDNASVAFYQALLRSITFSSTSDDPTAGGTAPTRTVTFEVSETGLPGGLSAPVTATVNVTAVDDAPVIANLDGDSVTFVRGGGGVGMDSNDHATVADVDSPNFDGGTLTVAFVNGVAEDNFYFPTNVPFQVGWHINLGGGPGYAEVEQAGTGGNPLVVSFHGGITLAQVAGMLESVLYFNSNTVNPSLTPRSVLFTLTDPGGASTTSTVTVNIDAGNTPPTQHFNTGLTLNEGASATISASQLDFDDAQQADSAITYTITSAATNGSLLKSGVALGLNGTFTQDDIDNSRITYTHDGSETTSASFGFSVGDGADGIVTGQSFAFTVTPVNDPPSVSGLPASLSFTEDTTGNIDLSAATFADPDTLSITVQLSVSSGTILLNGVDFGPSVNLVGAPGTINSLLDSPSYVGYAPAANFNGAATLTVKADDGSGFVQLGTIALNIDAVNDAPVFLNLDADVGGIQQSAVVLDTNVTVADVELDALNGGAGNHAGASLTVARSGGAAAEDSFGFSTAGALFTVNGSNLRFNGLTFATFTDSGGTLTIDFTSSGTNATTVLVNQVLRHIAYTNTSSNPPASATLDYTFHDGNTANAQGTGGDKTATGSITVNITATDHAPVPVADIYAATEDTALVVTAANGVLKNDTDAENDTLTAIKVSDPAHGIVTLNADGSFTYTPTANYNGTDSFTYKANDGAADSDPVTVTLNIAAVNDAPVAVADTYAATEDTALVVTAANGVLKNDTDAENNALTAAVVTGPSHGTLILNADGSFSYTPAANYNGTDSFTYKANDGQTDSANVTVTINVGAVNDAPVANADSYTATESIALVVNAANGVLKNDTDVENDTLTVSSYTQPSHGILVLNADGSFTYTPAAGYDGPDSFTYKAGDGTAESSSATVSIDVGAVNDPPVLANAIPDQNVNEDTAWSFQFAANAFTDPDSLLTYTATLSDGSDLPSWIAFDAGTRTFSGTPPQDFNGVIALKVTASDGEFSASDTFDVTVNPVNDPPVVANAIPDQNVNEDTAWSFQFAANALSDPDSSLTYTATLGDGSELPSWIAFDAGTRTFSGTPPQDFNGVIALKVTASDGEFSASDTFDVTVNPVNDPPVLANAIQDQSVNEDTAWSFQFAANAFTDVDNSLTYTATLGDGTALPTWLSFTSGTRTFSGTPPQDFNGAIALKVRASDGSLSVSDTFNLTVNPVNDAPVANIDSYTATESTPLVVDAANGVLKNDTDVENSALAVGSYTQPSHGTLVLNADGSFTYTPTVGYNGPDSFTYKANDGTADSQSATVNIAVGAVNDPPVLANAIPDQSVNEDAAWSFQFASNAFTDVDSSLTYTATLGDGTALPTWLSFTSGTRTFSGTPPQDFNGLIALKVTASDGSLNASDTFNLTVNPVNDAPTLTATPRNGTYTEGDVGVPTIFFSPTVDISTVESGQNIDRITLSITGIVDGASERFVVDGSNIPLGTSTTNFVTQNSGITVNIVKSGTTANITLSKTGGLSVADAEALLGVMGLYDSSENPTAGNRVMTLTSIRDTGGTANGGHDTTTLSLSSTFTIVPVNDPPVLAVNGGTSLNEGAVRTILAADLSATDVDNTPAQVTYTLTAAPTHGTLWVDANGNSTLDTGEALGVGATFTQANINTPSRLKYTHDGSETTSDSFGFNVSDGAGGSVTGQTFAITINPINDKPVLANAIPDQSVDEDTPWSFQFASNAFSDVDSSLTYTAKLASNAALPGWLTFTGATRTFSGTPPQDFNGSLDITVTASDGVWTVTDTFRLTVNAVNDPPVVANAIADQHVNEDTPWTFQVPSSAFSDVDSGSLGYTATLDSGDALPAWLTFTAATRTFSGTPPQDFTGTLDIKVTASDDALSVTDSFRLTVDPVNDLPVVASAIPDQHVNEDTPWSFQFASNAFSDVDNGSLIYTATLDNGDPLPAWLTFTAATQTFSGTPPQDFNGALDIKVTASDGTLSVSDTFRLTVDPENDAPVATADVFAVTPHTQLVVDAAHGVLANDTDIDTVAASLAAVLVTDVGHGALTLNADGSFSYTAGTGFSGVDSFTYKVNDGTVDSGTVTVTLNIAAADEAPVAQNDHYTTSENTRLVIAAKGVLANDTDIDGDTLHVSAIVTGPAHGSLDFGADGSFTYTPDTAFSGADSFTYSASDGARDSNVATVSLTVNPVNGAPTDVTSKLYNWQASGDLGAHPGNYQAAGVGDFNGDGTADVLWRNPTTGAIDEWKMQNDNWAGSVDLGSRGPGYQVAGIGDFNGDGVSDVLWRDTATGKLDAWIMQNGQWSKSVDLGARGADWKVLGVGDFNGDHTSDVLFQNTTTGAVDEWIMSGGNWSASTSLGSRDLAYSSVGIGDFDGDGTSDVLWHNPTNGAVDQWHMKDGNWAGSIGLGNFNTSYELAAVNDFNGDGTADVLWRNPTSGKVDGWVMDDGNWFASVSLGVLDPAYRLAGTGDFNHADGADVLWNNPTTGQSGTWLLHGV